MEKKPARNIVKHEASKRKLHISTSYLQQNLQKEIYHGALPFLKEKGFRVFSSKHWCCVAFLSRRASTNSKTSQEDMLFDRVANMSAIVDFFPFSLRDSLTERNFLILFYNDRTIHWACAVRKNVAFLINGLFLCD